jgi:hypothetical protein
VLCVRAIFLLADEALPMGGAPDGPSVSIPALMVPNTSAPHLLPPPSSCHSDPPKLVITPPLVEPVQGGQTQRWQSPLVISGVVSLLCLPFLPTPRLLTLPMLFLALYLWWLLRLGTCRRSLTAPHASTSPPGHPYHHQEGDEAIFLALVQSLREGGGYCLRPSALAGLRLAPENYGFSMFHHPPVFAVVALAGEWLGPYPLTPVFMQVSSLG